ncbi:hypothetical protein ABFA07_012979 [Porites harrisoni]
MAAERVECINKTAFYEAVDVLKSQQKTKQSQITLFVKDKFYNKAKQYIQSIIEDDLIVDQVQEDRTTSLLSTWEATTTRKKWKYSNDNIVTEKNKKVVSKRQLYDTLSFAHNRIANRGRQITMKWITENHTEVNQKVVNIFVKMCRFHQEQKTITSRVKPVKQPLEAQTFLSLLEIDLMDFRNCSHACTAQQHKWAINFIDHHTKFVHVLPLHSKSGKDVLDAFTQYCLTYGYPKEILTDNGKEFDNHHMKQFCRENCIHIAHGSPRTPTTQGLVERANRTWKDNARAVIMSKVQNKVDKWCKCTLEISYTMNIKYHSAIKTTPYEATFGFKAHRETLTTSNPDNDQTPEDRLHVAAEEQGTLADPLDTLQSPVQTDSMSPKKQSRTKRPSSHDNGTNEVDSRQQKRKKD